MMSPPSPSPLYASGLEKATPFKWSIFIKDMKMAHLPKAMRLKKKNSQKKGKWEYKNETINKY